MTQIAKLKIEIEALNLLKSTAVPFGNTFMEIDAIIDEKEMEINDLQFEANELPF